MIKLIDIPSDYTGIFIERINKYVATIEIKNSIEKVHVHDPGRLNELLFKGNKVLIKKENKPHRKTKFDLIAAWKNNHWVLIHSGYHRKIAEKIIEKKLIEIGDYISVKPEKTIEIDNHKSRIDFFIKREHKDMWIEVKGCTLTKNGIALFPDAPTKRGVKHLQALIDLKKKGYDAMILILIFRKDSKIFKPNIETDPDFAKVFKQIIDENINIFPVLLTYDKNAIFFKEILPFNFS